MRTSKSVKGILSTSEHLSKLIQFANQLEKLTRITRSCLPTPVNNHVNVANLKDNTLIIHTDSATWATQLRFHLPDLLRQLRIDHNLKSICSIRTKVVPNQIVTKTKAEHQPLTSPSSSALLQNFADSIDDQPLKEAIHRLAKNIA
ncbi:MAG: DUF721 domain-containing protein [Gammaproteobacteria bacterium]